MCTPPIITRPRSTSRPVLSLRTAFGSVCSGGNRLSSTPPMNGRIGVLTSHVDGTRSSTPPMTATMSRMASSPGGIVARRKSSWPPPMIAVTSPPRNGDALLERRTLLQTAKIERRSARSADDDAGGGEPAEADGAPGTNCSLAPNGGFGPDELDRRDNEPLVPSGPSGPSGPPWPNGPSDLNRRPRREPPVLNTRLKPMRIRINGQNKSQIRTEMSTSVLRKTHVTIAEKLNTS